MNYKERDRIEGEIYKGDDRITAVRHSGVTRDETRGLEFLVTVKGRPSKLEVGDDCRLVNEDGETKVKVGSMSTLGEPPGQTTFIMFSLMPD